jgi:septal ring factor EnvC (AmiA/AmiB activator)
MQAYHYMMKTSVLIYIFVFLHGVNNAQSISDLREKKNDALQQIQYTTRLLNESQKEEQTSLSKLRLLNVKINQRNTLVSNIEKEVDIFQKTMENNSLIIEILTEDIKRIKEEYARLIKVAYQNKNVNDKVIFLLSAENFNQAHRRFNYLKRYANYRKQQAETIETIQEELNEKIIHLEKQKQIKQELLQQALQETNQLASEKRQQNQTLSQLQQEQQSLKQKLNQQRRIEQQLEREIQRIIEEEARKNQQTGEPGFALTPEQKLVGNNFEQNKQRLPWPLERGIITERFGLHIHPVLKNVQIRNNGINIATEIGAKVRAVFNGEVSRVFGISGGNTAVIIRHGNYLSVYSNLKEVIVKQGDKVTTKQNIGTVYTDYQDSNKSILKFQIWKGNVKLNPEDWIGN